MPPTMRSSGSGSIVWNEREWKRIQLLPPGRIGQRIVSFGAKYIHTARDADGTPLWLNWMAIRACLLVLIIFWEPKPFHDMGAVDHTPDATATAVATI